MSSSKNSEHELSLCRGEAVVILPATLADVEVEHEDVLTQIVDAFGGFTLVPAIGGWKNDKGETEIEPVVSVTIPMDKHSYTYDTALEKIVDAFGLRYKQKTMYVRYADGRVSFRPVPQYGMETSAQERAFVSHGERHSPTQEVAKSHEELFGNRQAAE